MARYEIETFEIEVLPWAIDDAREGDIVLDPANALPFRYGMPRQGALETKNAVALADRSHLWPNAELPFAIDASAQSKASLIQWAVQHYGSTGLKLRPRNTSDRDCVLFRDQGEGAQVLPARDFRFRLERQYRQLAALTDRVARRRTRARSMLRPSQPGFRSIWLTKSGSLPALIVN